MREVTACSGEQGIRRELGENALNSLVADVLTYHNMMTNGKRERVSSSEHLADIYSRYDDSHIVSKAIHQDEQFLVETVQRTEQRLIHTTKKSTPIACLRWEHTSQ